MMTRIAIEYVIMAYVMTKHGIGVPIIGSMQRYWSIVLLRCLQLARRRRRFRSNDAMHGDSRNN